MEKDNLKYIKHIEIKGLWGRYDVNWDNLNSDVNILVGENGTGKSTILKLMNLFLDRNDTPLYITPRSKYDYLIDKFQELTIDYKNGHNTKATVDIDSDSRGLMVIPSDTGVDVRLKGTIDVELISTFDSLLSISDLDKKYNSELNTQLDFQLKKQIENYLNYQLNLTKKIINKKQDVELVFSKRKYFIETVNRLFEKTHKVIDEEENGIIFLLADKTVIESYDLSSGEKQLLIILLTVLCQDEKPSILLMDEPEVSLHLRWQYELIEILRTLNPNCQLIIATHSPSIFNHGWRDKVFWIEDIVKEKEAAHE